MQKVRIVRHLCWAPVESITGTRVMAVRGLSVLSRIYRRSGKGCAFHESDRLLVYASDELISVTRVFRIQSLAEAAREKQSLGALGMGEEVSLGRERF